MIEINHKGLVRLSENTELKDPKVSYVSSKDTKERVVTVWVKFHSETYSHVREIGTFEYEEDYQWTDDDLLAHMQEFLDTNTIEE